MYFVNAVLPRFQIPDEPIRLDFEAVGKDEALWQTIAAVSQAHFALHSKVQAYDTALIRKTARQSAIGGFRGCLEQGVQSQSSAQRLFIINILLCILDGMIEPSEDLNASTCHLRGGFAILDQWQNTPTRMLLQDGLEAHLLSVYATMDLVHALLSGDRPFFDSMIWKMFARVQTWFGRLPPGDKFLEILEAFSDMAALGNTVYANQPIDSTGLIQKCLGPIETIFRPDTISGSSDGDGLAEQDSWQLFCILYKICGLLYLERALKLRPRDHEGVQAAVQVGISILVDGRLPNMMQHCVILPMLVIGSHCTDSEARKAVLKVLSPSSSYLSFGNMRVMTEFLVATWDREGGQEKTWWECFEPVSSKSFLF